MYIDDPIAAFLGIEPLSEPIPEPNVIPFKERTNPPWNKGLTDLGGYKLSEQHKKNISLGRLRSTKCSPSPELRQQISNKLKGRTDYMKRKSDHYQARRVLHVESNTIYGSMIEAAEAFDITTKTVQRWCRAEQEGRVIPRNSKTKGITLRYSD